MGAVIILVIGGLLAAMLILPRQRELKRHTAVVDALEVGDQVMTGSGLYGTLTQLDGDLAWLEISPGVVIKLARRAVAAKIDDVPTTSTDEPATDGTADPAAQAGPSTTESADPAALVDPSTPGPQGQGQARDIDRRAS